MSPSPDFVSLNQASQLLNDIIHNPKAMEDSNYKYTIKEDDIIEEK